MLPQVRGAELERMAGSLRHLGESLRTSDSRMAIAPRLRVFVRDYALSCTVGPRPGIFIYIDEVMNAPHTVTVPE